MNTITIDSNIYQFAAQYAAKRRVSIESIVESYFLHLREAAQTTVEADKTDTKILSFDQLRPELQDILKLSAPLKGTVPEWDLNGDMARQESFQ